MKPHGLPHTVAANQSFTEAVHPTDLLGHGVGHAHVDEHVLPDSKSEPFIRGSEGRILGQGSHTETLTVRPYVTAIKPVKPSLVLHFPSGVQRSQTKSSHLATLRLRCPPPALGKCHSPECLKGQSWWHSPTNLKIGFKRSKVRTNSRHH